MESKNRNEDKNRFYAAIGTIVFHLLIVGVLLLSAFRTPLPLPSEEGVEVNLGNSETGMGDIQPLNLQQLQQEVANAKATSSNESYVTENTEDAPTIEEKKKKPTPTQTTTPDKPAEPTVNPNALYKGKSKDAQTGQNEGITGTPGDQGSPGGVPGSPNYQGTGGGSGSGISYDLGGRSVRSLPKPTYNSNEQGKIVVEIKVNKLGKVTYARAGARGTTISEISLRKQAEAAALRTQFVQDNNAPEEQRGTITYIFIKAN